MASTKATELAQLSRKLTYTEATNVAAIDGDGNFITTGDNSDQLPEGSTNLYFSNTRAQGAISVSGSQLGYSGGVITFTQGSTDTVTEGSSNLYYTDARVGSYLSANNWATQSYVQTELSNLVDSAPAALNTLNELAAAINDDANFSTTITNSLATKASVDDATALAIALG
ncbi:MAG: hypothetical protein CBB72_011320 [Muricauda sp. TMED12]|nr:MAG: hypothetical protein CBB72_011320 [Muricauda sp. TMED12]